MDELSKRQESILALVIHEYIESAQPVGSKGLVSKYALEVSPATVRSEMGALTEAGLLRQPHTSAGRVPTEEGYRYFVRRLLRETELPPQEKRLISHQFHQARADIDEWIRLAASVLAQHARGASLVTPPLHARDIFKHLELISTRGRQVLLVLVCQGGELRQRMLTLDETIEQPRLSQAADEINRLCAGMSREAVAQQAGRLSGFAQEVVRLVAAEMVQSEAAAPLEIYHDGLSNVLTQPEFADTGHALQALRLFEERTFLEEVVSKALSPGVGGVQVVIGGEGAWEELRDCSIVLSRYGVPGYATGALGVLGPVRMAYNRTISSVRYVANLMSNLIHETFAS
jgi:heat-inducible transcriptional repressor